MIKLIDNISFELKDDYNFSWLKNYGTLFCVFDQQDSGNICFGVTSGSGKLFIKYAGAPTINYDGAYEEAVLRMKQAVQVYLDITHPNLIKLVDHFEQGNGYASIYEWVEGECLHAHWNFEQVPKYTHPNSPNVRFQRLSLQYKLDCMETILSVHKTVAAAGYVAIDFYDGSIMYDFNKNRTTVCDIDFYNKQPYINTMGRMWGSSRFMSPEEFQLGAVIDEVSNVYTLGAAAYELLGDNKTRSLELWSAKEELYQVAKKATQADRRERYQSVEELYSAWMENMKTV